MYYLSNKDKDDDDSTMWVTDDEDDFEKVNCLFSTKPNINELFY